jgi:hypothetical protein
MTIHGAIITQVIDQLTLKMITEKADADPTKARAILRGSSQGNPDPDYGRIVINIYTNDPDQYYGKDGTGTVAGDWADVPEEIECGGAITMRRRFSLKARCLLVNTQEEVDDAQDIGDQIRGEIERALLELSFNNVWNDKKTEYVSRGVFSDTLRGEMIQAGGPPDSYDIHIKIRFEVLTTQLVTL